MGVAKSRQQGSRNGSRREQRGSTREQRGSKGEHKGSTEGSQGSRKALAKEQNDEYLINAR